MTEQPHPTMYFGALNDRPLPTSGKAISGRKLRPDLTPNEMERVQKYGAIEFKSAGATCDPKAVKPC